MYYAVNVADLANTPAGREFVVMMLLADVLSRTDPVVKVERKRFNGMGKLLHCEEERAQAIVDIIRQKYAKYELRFYVSKTGNGGWKRI